MVVNAISLPSGDQIGSRLIVPLDVKRVSTSRSSRISQMSGGPRSTDRNTATCRPSGDSDGRAPGWGSLTFPISLPERSNQMSGRAKYDGGFADDCTRNTTVPVADSDNTGSD